MTERYIRSIGFAGGHVFTYSPRPGTAAYKMKEQVPVAAAKARNAILREAFNETAYAYREKFIGKTKHVLWESSHKNGDGTWRLSGLTDNYVRVYSTAPLDLWNKITPVHLIEHHPGRSALKGVRE